MGNECKAYVLTRSLPGLGAKASGSYPPWTLSPPPYPPHCPTSYVACKGDGTGTLVENALGELPTQSGEPVQAVWNVFSAGGAGGPALPGAVGTKGCDCAQYYGNGTEATTACVVCTAIQMSAANGALLCDPRGALNDTNFACLAPYPGDGSRHIKCTVEGGWA